MDNIEGSRETMVRIGECIAITKSDIDFKNKTVTIDKQLIHYKTEDEKEGRLHISETKGRNGHICFAIYSWSQIQLYDYEIL